MKFSGKELLEFSKVDGGSFKVKDLASALEFCRKVTISHYENFPVASIIVPKDIRKFIYPVYAFARIADDIADEEVGLTSEERIKSLRDLDALVADIGSAGSTNPIIMGLEYTMNERCLPASLFHRLLEAFIMDVGFKRPNTMSDLEYYCHHSANPIGEIILYIFGEANERNIQLSDNICTGLQLVNFWQDISVDLLKGRCYLPIKILSGFELSPENLHEEKNSAKLKDCINHIYILSESYFTKGEGLVDILINKRLKFEIALTIEGGLFILEQVRKLNIELLLKRPTIRWYHLVSIIYRSILRYNGIKKKH
jgi:squalene synthase HpnC